MSGFKLAHDNQGRGYWYVIPAEKDEDFILWLRTLESYEQWVKGPPEWAMPVTDPQDIVFENWRPEAQMSEAKRIFTDIYDRKVWGDGSGGGSSPEAAATYVAIVSRLIKELKPKTILDVGCGDGWVASRFDLAGAHYIGIDVVQSVISECRVNHPWGTFACADILHDALPEADLVLCKEVTQHLSTMDIGLLLRQLRRYPAVLHCSSRGGDRPNQPINTGECRGVRLSWAPWDLNTDRIDHWYYGTTYYHAELWRPQA